MEDVDLRHAKEHLEELIVRATRGEDVRISVPNVGTVQLTVVPAQPTEVEGLHEHVPGRLKGKLTIPARLMEPMSEDELEEWYGAAK